MRESATEGLNLSDEAGLGDYHRALFFGVLGSASGLEGGYERAMKLAEESLKLSRDANDMGGMANSLLELGTASLWGSGDPEQARAFYEEGLAVSRKLGSASILRSCLNSVAPSSTKQSLCKTILPWLSACNRHRASRSVRVRESNSSLSLQEIGTRNRHFLGTSGNGRGTVALYAGPMEAQQQ
jgi:tetratricopeptide (TPR) repeat protein